MMPVFDDEGNLLDIIEEYYVPPQPPRSNVPFKLAMLVGVLLVLMWMIL